MIAMISFARSLHRSAAGALTLALLWAPIGCASADPQAPEAPGAPEAAAWNLEILPAPPFPEGPPAVPPSPPKPLLERVSSKPNQITDDDAWFASNGLKRPELGMEGLAKLPDTVPHHFRPRFIGRVFESGDSLFIADGEYLAAADPKTYAFKYGYDFSRWLHPPDDKGELNAQEVIWAVEEDGILYVSHGHRTYARESGGRTAYLTAIDPTRDQVLWRAGPLVANARTFLVQGDLIVSGYGFTAEPDFLYLLDRKTGKVVERHPLKTGPAYILAQNDLVLVRCYDTDDVFRLRR